MIGRVVEAWTSATRSADVEIEVIIQAAPTPWISEPRFEASVANHTLRKMPDSKGARAPGRTGMGWSGMPLWPVFGTRLSEMLFVAPTIRYSS